MEPFSILSGEFTAGVVAAATRARAEALAGGQRVIFRDELGRYIAEMPNGQRFEVRLRPGAPREESVEIIRELSTAAV